MVKSKDIKLIKRNILKYKKQLQKETDLVKRFDIKYKLQEEKYKLDDVQIQLLNFDTYLYKSGEEIYKSLFIDRYVYGLTQQQLISKYNIAVRTLYDWLSIARTVFEGKKHL